MPLVRLTMFPNPVEVPDDEVPVLRAQGLLAEDTATPPTADPAPAKLAPKPKDT